MRTQSQEANFSDRSNGLKPIYQKVQQLLREKASKNSKKQEKQYIRMIQTVSNLQLRMKIDRAEQFKNRRIEMNKKKQKKEQSILRISASPNKAQIKPNADELRNKTKSQRMLNFLKTNSTKTSNRGIQSPSSLKQNVDNIEIERQKFTPMRSVSRYSRYSHGIDSISESMIRTQFTKKSGTHSISSGSYNQAARLSQSSSNKSIPSKYLRKGHRMRQTLLKKLQVDMPEDIQQQKQLVYLKEYDQWVPAALASFKKLQLEHFMNILTGGKKNQGNKQIIFEPVYL